ncbi:alpha/beta hydrolase family protein [Sphingomonas jaspsi]|uniref:alpha/beta hydrolase family protein n=1 Tax=Sphingomonas jaspsi TaxID=392409 RepID=UPI0004B28BBD|nr:S9 family peptidase [Sphingomonas jaspsi]
MKFCWSALLLAGCAISANAQAPSSQAPATPIPVATFAQFPALSGAKLSKDGQLIAAKLRVGDEKVLGIIDLAQPNAKPNLVARDGEFMGYGQKRVIDWSWFDDQNLIITLAEYTAIDGDKTDVLRLINYNARTKKVTLLGWDDSFLSANNILWRSHEGRPRILLSRFRAGKGYERLFNPEVIEVDLETGKQTIVQQRNPVVGAWEADGNGVVRLGFGTDREKGKRTVLYRKDASSPFKTIIDEKMERYSDGNVVPSIFLADGKTGIATSRSDGYSAAFEIDLDTMKLGKKIFSVPGYDIDAVLPNEADNAIEAIAWTDTKARRKYFTPRLAEIQAGLDDLFGKGNAYIASADRARERILVMVGSSRQRGSYYLYDTRTGQVQMVGYLNNSLKDMDLNPVQTVRYKARDGQSIEAFLTLPRLKPAKALPLIVLPHGGPWARDEEGFDRWAQPLAELGYAVIQPNYRGSSGYGKAWEKLADGNWGASMQDDLLDAITYLAGQGIADPKRVCIMGWSYGGYAASRAAQRDGKYYRCAISGAGVHDLPDMVAYDKNYLGAYGATYIGSAGRLADISPARHAAEFSIPILIVHGAKDDRVPVSQSRDLVKKLKDAGKVEGKDFVYLEQPKNTHHFPFEKDEVQFIEAVRDFLAKHNPA